MRATHLLQPAGAPVPLTLFSSSATKLVRRQLVRRGVPITPLVPFLAFEQNVFENVAERQHALEPVVFVNDDEAVDARLADRVKDGVEAVVEGAGVDAGKVLREMSG